MRRVDERGVAWAFWARAESLRVEQCLTMLELCKRSGVRRQTYSELQRTTRRPQRYIVVALAATLGIEINEALALAGLNPTDSDMVRRAIVAAHDLDDGQKQALLILLDGYDKATTHPPLPAAFPRTAPVAAHSLAPVARIA